MGRHFLIDYGGCDSDVLADRFRVERAMLGAARAMGASVVKSVFHSFNPLGISGVIVIKESHLAVHTWPEHGFASVDFYTCGSAVDPRKAVRFLGRKFGAKKSRVKVFARQPPR